MTDLIPTCEQVRRKVSKEQNTVVQVACPSSVHPLYVAPCCIRICSAMLYTHM